MPVWMEIACLTPGAWSSVRVQVMDVSFVLRLMVAVRIGRAVMAAGREQRWMEGDREAKQSMPLDLLASAQTRTYDDGRSVR
jgi:hypothetical protein